MRRFRFHGLAALIAIFALIAAACSNDTTTSAAGGSSSTGSTQAGVCAGIDTTGTDALAAVCKSGQIRVATDQKYKPQSWYDVKTSEWKGFDVDVANEIATRLGVTADIQHHDWDTDVTAGSWNNRYDMDVGSMTITQERKQKFLFTPVYYYTPASIAVHSDNTSIQDVTTDLSGKKICVGSGTTYESYLRHDLNLGPDAPKFDYVVDNAQIEGFNTDTDALDALALGDGVRCDAAMTALPTIAQYMADGNPVKIVGDPLYNEPLAVAFDKNDPVDNATLVAAVATIIDGMHADGTLTSLSEKWYHGQDLTTSASSGG
jgi:polar amino acid transport system substrate-binding protein